MQISNLGTALSWHRFVCFHFSFCFSSFVLIWLGLEIEMLRLCLGNVEIQDNVPCPSDSNAMRWESLVGIPLESVISSPNSILTFHGYSITFSEFFGSHLWGLVHYSWIATCLKCYRRKKNCLLICFKEYKPIHKVP